MPTMPRPNAETLFSPHSSTLIECVRGAVEDYFAEYTAGTRAIHSRRTRANIIRDHMIHRAQLAFAGTPGVNLVKNATKGRYTLLSVSGQALLRFKYLGANKRSRNYATDLATKFADNQECIDGLPPGATRFDVGYTWNNLQTSTREVSISCPTPAGIEYVISLWLNEEQPQLPDAMPPEIGPVETGSETKVVAKDASIETVKDADAGA